MMHIPYGGLDTLSQLAFSTQRSHPRRSRLHNLPLLVSLATAISVVAILVSLSICRALRSREQGLGVAVRRLSDGAEYIDEEALSVLEGCLELEAELGIMEKRAASSSEEDSSNAVMRLVSMLTQAAAEKGSLQEYRPVVEQLDLNDQVPEEQSGFESEGGEVVRLDTPPFQTSVGSPGSTGVAPALDPDSWLDTIPSISLPPENRERADLFWGSNNALNTEQSSAPPPPKRGRVAGGRDVLLSGDVRSHPYVRLPMLKAGVAPRSIHASEILTKLPRRFSPHRYLLFVRKLFLQETLSQRDVNDLLVAIEELASMSYHRGQRPPRGINPVFIVEALGYYFMIFDAIVCAIELLGEPMHLELWWNQFTENFVTRFPLSVAPATRSEMAQFNLELARRLSDALDIYKQGRRPPLQEVIALKNKLFCSPLGRNQFKRARWDPWRDDGKCS